ncbi:MAG: putative Ig domain-containing protein, partial [Candidatus Thorarchaeota archaeon]
MTDGYGGSDSVVVTIDVNTPPVIDEPASGTPYQIIAGRLLVIDVNASDIDDDPLEYSTNVTFGYMDATTGNFTWTPDPAHVGSHDVKFIVNDTLTTDDITVFIEVLPQPGTLTAVQLDPSSDTDVGRNIFFDYTTRANCGGSSSCGSITATLIRFINPLVVYTFTTCGHTGYNGPNQSQCNAAYSGTNLDGQVSITGPSDGIQEWTVPATGTYRIEVEGAKGGNNENEYTGLHIGGSGAKMGADFNLNAGETLYIMVGQEGEVTTYSYYGSGGGGGSYVAMGPSYTSSTLLIAAGGGGGATRNFTGLPGLTSECGGDDGSGYSSGGCSGQGGTGGGSSAGFDSGGGGGAGWNSDGDDANGGAGGGFVLQTSSQGATYFATGGFGGAGGGEGGAGAGGGYSGGGGGVGTYGGNYYYNPGGGGGSYINYIEGATNTITESGYNDGIGKVTITLIPTTETELVPMYSGTPFYTNVSNPSTGGCLDNMQVGQNCDITWPLNATGEVDNTHTLFVTFDSDNPEVVDIDSSEIDLTIINNPPIIIAPPNNTQYETTVCKPIVIDVNATDPNGDNITYHLIYGTDTGVQFDNSTGILNWTSPLLGTIYFAFVATDSPDITCSSYPCGPLPSSSHTSDLVSVGITVLDDVAPFITAPSDGADYQVNVDETLLIDVNATDPDGDTLTYSFEMPYHEADLGYINESTGLYSWTPNKTEVGNYTIIFYADDFCIEGFPGQFDTITVYVDVPNRAPNITYPPNGTVFAVGVDEIITIDVNATDADGHELTYSRIPAMMGSMNPSTGLFSWDSTGYTGTNDVTFIVEDEYGGQDSVNVSIVVNNPPVITVPAAGTNYSVNAEDTILIDVDALDPDDDTLTYAVSPLLPGISMNSTTGLFNWTPGIADLGSYLFTFTATDPYFVSDSIIVNITVKVNTPPLANDVELRSRYGTNTTVEDLLLTHVLDDLDNDPVKGIIDWKLNGNSIASLNMPFENDANQNVHDYSDNNHVATVHGAFFDSFSGQDGWGAYKFDGFDDKITTNVDLNAAEGSMMFWINTNGEDDGIPDGVIGNRINDTDPWEAQIIMSPDDRLALQINDDRPAVQSDTVFNDSTWHHVAAVWGPEGSYLYVDAVAENYSSTPTSVSEISNNVWIGTYHNQSSDRFFSGYLDEVLIFDRALSAEQISAMYNADNYRTDIIASSENYIPGYSWQACVTPNDRLVDGLENCSNELEVIKKCLDLSVIPGTINVYSDLVLCTDTYYIDDMEFSAQPKFQFRGGSLDCNGSTIISSNGRGIFSYSKASDTIVRNCTIVDFSTALKAYNHADELPELVWQHHSRDEAAWYWRWAGANVPIDVDQDGNYISGTSLDRILEGQRWAVEKIDPDGNHIWTYLSEPNVDADEWIFDLAVDHDGNVVAVGRVQGNPAISYDRQWGIYKIDGQTGDLIWEYLYNPTTYSEEAERVIVDHDGNYVIYGRGRVMKLSPGKSVLGIYSLTGGWAEDITVDHDGNYVLAGARSIGASNKEFYMLKLDSNFSLVWDYGFTPSGATNSEAGAVAVDREGNYLMAGYSDYYTAVLVKMDSDGNMIWDRSYNWGYQYVSVNTLIVEEDDNDYILGGTPQLMKVDSNGVEFWRDWLSPRGVVEYDGDYLYTTGATYGWYINKIREPSVPISNHTYEYLTIKGDGTGYVLGGLQNSEMLNITYEQPDFVLDAIGSYNFNAYNITFKNSYGSLFYEEMSITDHLTNLDNMRILDNLIQIEADLTDFNNSATVTFYDPDLCTYENIFAVRDGEYCGPYCTAVQSNFSSEVSLLREFKLSRGDDTQYYEFGNSLSISGDYAIVGAHYDDGAGTYSGSAYIFWYNGTTWIEQQKIYASDAAASAQF